MEEVLFIELLLLDIRYAGYWEWIQKVKMLQKAVTTKLFMASSTV